MNSFEREWEKAETASIIASLGPDLVHRLPGCDDAEIRFALRDAYADFCRLSSCYTRDREIPLADGESWYPVPPFFPDCHADSVTRVLLNGVRLRPGAGYRVETSSVPIIVLRGAWAAGKLTVTAIDIPNHGAERVPHWFINKYGGGVVAGALARLFGMSGRPWADPAQERAELVRWENFLSEARLRNVYAPDGPGGSGALSALDTSCLL